MSNCFNSLNHSCHPLAVPYIRHFSSNREDLKCKLFRLYNEEIFHSVLDPDMEVTWCPRLLKTAGTCRCKERIRSGTKERQRFATIRLASKVIDSPDRLRDTLIHEMCHAATWVISGEGFFTEGCYVCHNNRSAKNNSVVLVCESVLPFFSQASMTATALCGRTGPAAA